MAKRRQRRKREKDQRHAPKPVRVTRLDDGEFNEPVEPLVFSREQAAQALGVSLATLDRRVVPAIAHRLNRDGVSTGQGGRQWWPSAVRAVLGCRNSLGGGDPAPVTAPREEEA